jgi:hypothetical protein
VNDAGWVQMPLAKRYKLARAVTMRRVEYAMFARYPNINPGDYVDGVQFFRWDDTGEIGPAWEIAKIRDYAFENNSVTQRGFNEFLQSIFLDSIDWLESGGANACKAFKDGRAVEMFLDEDIELFNSIRVR